QERRIRDVESGLAACMYEYFIVGRRDVSRRMLIEKRYEGVYGNLFTLIHEGVQRKEFYPTQPVQTFVHWLISSLDGIFIESLINGSEKIELSNQFELLKSICQSILMPIEMEEVK